MHIFFQITMKRSNLQPSKQTAETRQKCPKFTKTEKPLSPVQRLLVNIQDELSQKQHRNEAAINQLPDEVLIKILSFSLERNDALCDENNIFQNVRLTCKKWFLLCTDREPWKNFAATVAIGCPELFNCLRGFLRYVRGIRNLWVGGSGPAVSQSVPVVWQFCDLLSMTRGLEHLSIELQHMKLGPMMFKAVKTFCPNLRHMSLVAGEDVTSWTCFEMLENLTRLDIFFIVNVRNEEFLTLILRRVKNLKTLQLTKPCIDVEKSVEHIAKNSSLIAFVLNVATYDHRVQSGYLSFSGKMDELETLAIRNYIHSEQFWEITLSEACLVDISRNCLNLKHLCLASNDTGITPNGIYAVVNNLKFLQTLILDQTSITDICLKYISQYCGHLERLSFNGCLDLGLGVKGLHYVFSNNAVFCRTLKKLRVCLDRYRAYEERGKPDCRSILRQRLEQMWGEEFYTANINIDDFV